MSSIGERVRAEREAQQISRAELARFAGIAVSTLSDLELGLSSGTTKIHRIASRLGVRPEWLETGRGQKVAVEADADEWTDILCFAQAASLGNGATPDEYAEAHKLKFRSSSLARKGLRPGNLSVFYGDGDSMLPRIKKGDAILFNTSERSPVDGAIFVVQFRGEIFAKRCEVIGDMVFFRSDNPNGDHAWNKPRRLDDPRDPIEIVGRVRWIGSWED